MHLDCAAVCFQEKVGPMETSVATLLNDPIDRARHGHLGLGIIVGHMLTGSRSHLCLRDHTKRGN